MYKPDFLLEPKKDDFLIPEGVGVMTYINEKIGWRKSEYYMVNGHIEKWAGPNVPKNPPQKVLDKEEESYHSEKL